MQLDPTFRAYCCALTLFVDAPVADKTKNYHSLGGISASKKKEKWREQRRRGEREGGGGAAAALYGLSLMSRAVTSPALTIGDVKRRSRVISPCPRHLQRYRSKEEMPPAVDEGASRPPSPLPSVPKLHQHRKRRRHLPSAAETPPLSRNHKYEYWYSILNKSTCLLTIECRYVASEGPRGGASTHERERQDNSLTLPGPKHTSSHG